METIRGSLARAGKSGGPGGRGGQGGRSDHGGIGLEDAADARAGRRGRFRESRSSSRCSISSISSAALPPFSPATPARSRLPRSRPIPGAPTQVIGMHFMNPVPVMQAGRGDPGPADQLTRRPRSVMELGRGAGQDARRGERLPGLRLQPRTHADDQRGGILRHGGVAAPEAIDTVMKLGMAHPMGPLALADLHRSRHLPRDSGGPAQGTGRRQVPALSLLRRMVAAGTLGRKTGRGFYKY